MSLSDQEKTELFKCIKDNTVMLGRVDERLKAGDRKFQANSEDHKKYQTSSENLHIHLGKHRSFRWMVGVIGTIISVVGTWWLAVKGH